MGNAKLLAIKKETILKSVYFLALIAAATFAPLLGHQQFISGPLVNAVLFISVAVLNAESAIVIGLFPSIYALSVGVLPSVLAPMIPFIMLGNAILVVAFSRLRKINFWFGMLGASFLKFVFLAASSSVVINLIIKKEVAVTAANMMSWPQLLTAVLGGIAAYAFLRAIKRV